MLLDVFTYGGPLAAVAGDVAEVEGAGLDGWFVSEATNDPFVLATLAADHSERITIGTAVAVALARNPMSVAYLARDLQEVSGGRFVLGLGSQIRPHITRRYSARWESPIDQMREFVQALHAIWDAWAQGSSLDFRGEHYQHTLMPPMMRPHVSLPSPPVYLAAVGPRMTRLAGEVADGVFCHVFSTPRYLREQFLPTLHEGVSGARRQPGDVAVCASAFTVTGETDEAVEQARQFVRRQISFYGSTPSYRGVLALHGWEELHTELHEMSRAGRWDEMPELIDDEVLEAFAVTGEPRELGRLLRDRYEGIADRVSLTTAVPLSPEVCRAVMDGLRSPDASRH